MELGHQLPSPAAMPIAGSLAGRVWFYRFGFALPGYLAGGGGFTALPVRELMRRMGSRYR